MTQELDIDKLVVDFQSQFMHNLEILLSGFIHDLNNPIAVIAGQSSILKTIIGMGKYTEEKGIKTCTKVMASTKKMSDIMELLRDFYKPKTVDSNKTNVKLSLDTIFKLSATKIYREELNVESVLFEEDIFCEANPLQFNMLIWNLHYLVLDHLNLNKDSALNITTSTDEANQATITYQLSNGLLPDDIKEKTEYRIINYIAKKIGGEIQIPSMDKITFTLNLVMI